MTIKEAFKIGFAKEMVRQSITPEQLDSLLVKYAAGGDIAKGFGLIGGGLKALGGAGAAAGKLALIGVPTAAALGGWALGSNDDVTKEDIKDLEQMATVHEYENAIKSMRKVDDQGKRKRVVRPAAGQSTQSVVEPSLMPKAAAAVPPVSANVPAPRPPVPLNADQRPISKRIADAKQKVAPVQLAPGQKV